ncbi:MAG: DNA-processing protein DprA [Bacteroidales bacterium]|nr:DNA-processing protein DprA [Bacteroidales bacterium]
MPDAAVPPELADHLALALIPGLGPKLTAAVLQHFGSAAAARQATAPQLEAIPLIGAKLATKFAAALRRVDITQEWQRIQLGGVSLALLGTPEYPAPLATIPDPPPLLYFRGAFAPADGQAIGIVGSRNCTPYGIRMAERIAAGLARAGWTVISGLARGIDGAAHRGALDAGGRTIAILAGGLSSIYPPEHAHLAEAIARQGALATETPMTVDPQPGMFPARNRIISGLSRAIVVVEANVKSGALITVTHAAEQGRDVYAVPGNADSPASAGCLDLIRKGARLVRSAEDILEDVGGLAPFDPPKPTPRRAKAATGPTLFTAPESVPESGPPSGLEGALLTVWENLTQPRHADDVARETGLPAGELATILMRLEMKKVIRRLPGNMFERRG